MVIVRAVYQDGKFQPLESVDLPDGQEVQLQIVSDPPTVRELIDDMLVSFDISNDDFDEDALQHELDEALKETRPLSDIIIEERRTGR
jgi:predicted DNA-binding antitoxin AbrB/MazE fold protein